MAAGFPACRRGGGERCRRIERGGVHRGAQTGEGSRNSSGAGDRPAERPSGAGAGGSRCRHAAASAPGPADDMLTLPASVRVFVARGATDLRRSFDRLSAQVQEVLGQDPLSGHVFVFFNRQRNRVKLLVWERDGFWLLYKRLEAGTFAALDRDEINARELYLLLEGIEVVRERRRYTRLPIGG